MDDVHEEGTTANSSEQRKSASVCVLMHIESLQEVLEHRLNVPYQLPCNKAGYFRWPRTGLENRHKKTVALRGLSST